MTISSVEGHLGLTDWSSEGEGTGGVLKVRVEDFRVEEIARVPALDPKGRFTVVRATLHNWETNRYLNRLAKACRISRKRIFSSGMKDKRAVTVQAVTAYRVPMNSLLRINSGQPGWGKYGGANRKTNGLGTLAKKKKRVAQRATGRPAG